MPVAAKRTQVWLTGLGDWSWPGTAPASELLPPPWVPAQPPAPQMAAPLGAAAIAAPRPSALPRRLGLAGALSALATGLAVFALGGPSGVQRLVEGSRAGTPVAATQSAEAASDATPLPALLPVSGASTGSAIDHTNFVSRALGRGGSFYVYLPPGFASGAQRYPVMYLLPGYKQSASAFLEIGLQRTLDRLIAHHTVQPMIAVLIQGGPGHSGWGNVSMPRYENYVVEVQSLIDRMLPTLAERGMRGIAGDSLGGYGAMNVALDNPYRYGVVESWLAFFNGLDRKLRAARPVIGTLGLHAYLYGAASDKIADPAQDSPFGAALRAAGADAHAAVYPGEHNVQTVQEHLTRGLTFAGRAFAAASR